MNPNQQISKSAPQLNKPMSKPMNAYEAPANHWVNMVRPNSSAPKTNPNANTASSPQSGMDEVLKAHKPKATAKKDSVKESPYQDRATAEGLARQIIQERERQTRQLHALTLEHAEQRRVTNGEPGNMYRMMGNWANSVRSQSSVRER